MRRVFVRKDRAKQNLIEKTILEKYNQYFRLAYSYVHNEDDAYDIVQNGACKAIQSSESLRNEEYVSTWIYRIMINECLKYVQKTKVVSYEVICEEGGGQLGSTEDVYENVDLKIALYKLDPKDRIIIILKYFESMKFEEIASILDENISTVKTRLYRSMKKLKDML